MTISADHGRLDSHGIHYHMKLHSLPVILIKLLMLV